MDQRAAPLRCLPRLARDLPLTGLATPPRGVDVADAVSRSGSDRLPDVSVIVAIYNAQETLRACVESLLQLAYPRRHLELLCVDNASTDATASILAEYRSGLTTVREPRRGPAAARNRGLFQARGDVVAFTDSDCVVDRDWLAHLIGPLGDPTVGVVGGKILSRRPGNAVERFGEQIHDHDRALNAFAPPYAITMNWASRRDVLATVGVFNEDLLRCSDVDLSYRMVQAGYRLVYAAKAVVYHRNERTAWGLMHEGYVHGFHAVEVRALHAGFLQGVRAARLDGRRSLTDSARRSQRVPQRWEARLCWSLFNLGKRVGHLHGSWVAARRPGR